MIYIEKNKVNKVVLTLSESSTLSTWLIKFTPNYPIDAAPFYFATPDISAHTNRYNLFLITESPTGSETGGLDVPLSLKSGQYTYECFQTTQLSDNPAHIVGDAVEVGFMKVELEENLTDIYD
jgi:hypothetical protein